MKPKVYIETSVVSYLTARRSNDVRTIALQNATIEWWETRRQHFEAVVSEFVLTEAGDGHPHGLRPVEPRIPESGEADQAVRQGLR